MTRIIADLLRHSIKESGFASPRSGADRVIRKGLANDSVSSDCTTCTQTCQENCPKECSTSCAHCSTCQMGGSKQV